MPLSKIQAESMNLADTYAFTGTVSGAGGLVKLLNTTASSGASEYIVDSTYINSTYDNYKIIAGYQYKSAFVADQEINMIACLTEIMAGCKFK